MFSRHGLAAAGLAALLVTGGCVGFLTGSQPQTFEAEPALVERSVASDAGYRLNGTADRTITREFTVAGQTREAAVINKVSTYEKTIDLGPLGEREVGVFAVVSTPAVELGPETFNPVADYSNRQLVDLLASNYQGLDDVERVGSRTLTVLGTETEVAEFTATATFAGQAVDVAIHVTKLRDGGDFVVPVGIYPRLKDGERENVFAMMRAIRHPAAG